MGDDSCLDVDDIILADNIKDNIKEALDDKPIYLIHCPGGEGLEEVRGEIKLY